MRKQNEIDSQLTYGIQRNQEKLRFDKAKLKHNSNLPKFDSNRTPEGKFETPRMTSEVETFRSRNLNDFAIRKPSKLKKTLEELAKPKQK